MQNFSNETIDIKILPKFEEVQFTPLNSKYKNIIIFNLALILLISITVLIVFSVLSNEKISTIVWIIASIAFPVIFGILYYYFMLSFQKRGFAFREHDVLFKNGVISNNTTIIPYSRVQHVAVHQGFLSRKLGLSAIEIFTAGGSGSDLEIPGLEKEEAERIKLLLMTKLNFEINTTEIENEVI